MSIRQYVASSRSARAARLAAAVAAALALAACGGGGESASIAPATGQLSVGLTDGPVENATEVVVVFTGLELQRRGGDRVQIDFDPPQKIDLLKLQGGVTRELTTGRSVPAGEYEWLRLEILASQNVNDQSYIRLQDGTQWPLFVPSGFETGLKLVRPFTVAQGSVTSLLVDFDLRKSVTAPPGRDPNYLLKPALRLLDRLQVGTLRAGVDVPALASAQGVAAPACRPALYLYPGTVAKADDVDGNAADGADPLLFLPVPYDGATTPTAVTIPFLEAGGYSLFATCSYDVDTAIDSSQYDPNAASGQPGYRTMKWTGPVAVTVAVGATAAVAVPPAP